MFELIHNGLAFTWIDGTFGFKETAEGSNMFMQPDLASKFLTNLRVLNEDLLQRVSLFFQLEGAMLTLMCRCDFDTK